MFNSRPPNPRKSHTWDETLLTKFLTSLGSNRRLSAMLFSLACFKAMGKKPRYCKTNLFVWYIGEQTVVKPCTVSNIFGNQAKGQKQFILPNKTANYRMRKGIPFFNGVFAPLNRPPSVTLFNTVLLPESNVDPTVWCALCYLIQKLIKSLWYRLKIAKDTNILITCTDMKQQTAKI